MPHTLPKSYEDEFMPLPAIRMGTATQCTARAKSRNLERCLCVTAFGTNVCRSHGAVHPDKRPKGKNHSNYKNGNRTPEKIAEHKEQAAVLRNLEDVLFVIGAIEGKQHTRGRKPADYENIKTIEKAEDYIIKLEEKT
jgi:hypothetical protein